MVPTFLHNVHNFVIKILILNAKNQSIFFSDVRRTDMGHLSLKKQLPSVSLVSSGADLITMLSSWLYNAHSFVINRFTFFPVLILSAFQNWTKFPTAQQPNMSRQTKLGISQLRILIGGYMIPRVHFPLDLRDPETDSARK